LIPTEVGELTTNSWRGDAATEFANGWTEVRDGGTQIIAALTTMAEKLGVTADTYQSRDLNTAAALNNSSLDLP
jgi:WXG100 family type VII secretion target